MEGKRKLSGRGGEREARYRAALKHASSFRSTQDFEYDWICAVRISSRKPADRLRSLLHHH